MLWKNCQGVDSQRLASTYAYCSENLSDLGDRQTEGKAEKVQERERNREREKKQKQEGTPV